MRAPRLGLVVLTAVIAAGLFTLASRDERYRVDAQPVAGHVEALFTRGGGRGQTRHARVRFRDGAVLREGTVQLDVLSRPAPGDPIALLHAPGHVPLLRVDSWAGRRQAIDAALAAAGIAAFAGVAHIALTPLRRRESARSGGAARS